jgi:hypothetical protein
MKDRGDKDKEHRILFEEAVRGELKLALLQRSEQVMQEVHKMEVNSNPMEQLPRDFQEKRKITQQRLVELERDRKTYHVKLSGASVRSFSGAGYAWETWALLRRSVRDGAIAELCVPISAIYCVCPGRVLTIFVCGVLFVSIPVLAS